jgi:hypothetical protein
VSVVEVVGLALAVAASVAVPAATTSAATTRAAVPRRTRRAIGKGRGERGRRKKGVTAFVKP